MRAVIVVLIAVLAFILFKVILMRLKAGASLDGVSWRMFYAAIVAEPIFKRYGESELVITAGTDGAHMEGSLHYLGLALDLRTWAIKNLTGLRDTLRKALGPDYDVVIEGSHMHVEYDPKA